MPASTDLIDVIREYIKSPLFLRSLKDLNNTTENDENECKIENVLLEDKNRVAVVNLFSSLLGGLTSSELLDIIPKV